MKFFVYVKSLFVLCLFVCLQSFCSGAENGPQLRTSKSAIARDQGKKVIHELQRLVGSSTTHQQLDDEESDGIPLVEMADGQQQTPVDSSKKLKSASRFAVKKVDKEHGSDGDSNPPSPIAGRVSPFSGSHQLSHQRDLEAGERSEGNIEHLRALEIVAILRDHPEIYHTESKWKWLLAGAAAGIGGVVVGYLLHTDTGLLGLLNGLLPKLDDVLKLTNKLLGLSTDLLNTLDRVRLDGLLNGQVLNNSVDLMFGKLQSLGLSLSDIAIIANSLKLTQLQFGTLVNASNALQLVQLSNLQNSVSDSAAALTSQMGNLGLKLDYLEQIGGIELSKLTQQGIALNSITTGVATLSDKQDLLARAVNLTGALQLARMADMSLALDFAVASLLSRINDLGLKMDNLEQLGNFTIVDLAQQKQLLLSLNSSFTKMANLLNSNFGALDSYLQQCIALTSNLTGGLLAPLGNLVQPSPTPCLLPGVLCPTQLPTPSPLFFTPTPQSTATPCLIPLLCPPSNLVTPSPLIPTPSIAVTSSPFVPTPSYMPSPSSLVTPSFGPTPLNTPTPTTWGSTSLPSLLPSPSPSPTQKCLLPPFC